nr:immunoglobulin heavy chain junction region [Macaca mulatta]MOV46773.1 immunoglobulin heavy chain junction region [Macaca mulatta]MOV49273.1 immunoglobulin heavy chain junction region [Macaca mulatta]MOV49499.1 immunoglobulin heavy chain junction region [Macaca mulatta]MOV49627.1 immunoglobulin heavy chain junction region [Macaca mulatta]
CARDYSTGWGFDYW